MSGVFPIDLTVLQLKDQLKDYYNVLRFVTEDEAWSSSKIYTKNDIVYILDDIQSNIYFYKFIADDDKQGQDPNINLVDWKLLQSPDFVITENHAARLINTTKTEIPAGIHALLTNATDDAIYFATSLYYGHIICLSLTDNPDFSVIKEQKIDTMQIKREFTTNVAKFGYYYTTFFGRLFVTLYAPNTKTGIKIGGAV